MGYTNVRHYHGGIADWIDAGLPVESGSGSAGEVAPAEPARRARAERPTLSRRRQWGNAILDFIERMSPARIFSAWLGMVLLCGLIYWLTALLHGPGLVDSGRPIAATFGGLLSALYFSFVTTTSVGYGDVLPLGSMRILAVIEAVAGLLLFGALVAKFVSRRQDELVREIFAVTFENRLDRMQTNLHLVLSELQAIARICDEGVTQPERLNARLESAVLVFGGELRAIHSLLYSRQAAPEEAVLEAILIALDSALRTLSDLLACLPHTFERAATLSAALKSVRALAEDICADCVPQVYAPGLARWMDRVQQTARKVA
jgi:hypothetical protein